MAPAAHVGEQIKTIVAFLPYFFVFLGSLPSPIFPDSGAEGCVEPPGGQMAKVRHSRLVPANLVPGCWAMS